jgi:hypothetical protein
MSGWSGGAVIDRAAAVFWREKKRSETPSGFRTSRREDEKCAVIPEEISG